MRPISAGGWNRSRRARHKRPKPQGSSDSYASPTGPTGPVPYSSWPSSESSQPQMVETYSQTSPVPVPFFPVLGNPAAEQPRPQQPLAAPPGMLQPPEQLGYNFNVMPSGQGQLALQPLQMEPLQNVQNFYSPLPLVSAQSFNPYMPPVMAVILPNYPNLTPGFPSIPSAVPQGPSMITGYAPGSVSFPQLQPQFQVQTGPHTQTSPGLLLSSQKAASSIGEEEEAAGPQALFSSSRSSSPLQLNLLQEELPRQSEGQSSTGLNHPESLHEQHAIEVSLNLWLVSSALKILTVSWLKWHWYENCFFVKGDAPSESGNQDGQSTSSELLDLLLQEDARSGTGSNASGSGSGESGGSLGSGSGSGSNETSTSHTGTNGSTLNHLFKVYLSAFFYF